MKNSYTINETVCTIEVVQRNGTKHAVFIDTSDLPKLQGYNVSVNKHGTGFCAIITKPGESHYLHRFLSSAPSDMEVDHEDGNALNNVTTNRRIVTHAQNQQNRKLNSNSYSGIRGVSWDTRAGKWRANVTLNKKMHWLGFFDDLPAAEKAVTAFRKLHMPFSKEV